MDKNLIKEINELIEDGEAQRQSLHGEYERMANELIDWDLRLQNWHELVRAYMKKHAIESTTPDNIKLGNLTNKSYPDLIIEIAKQSGGILNMSDATDILFEAKVGGDKKHIRHNIDTARYRMSEHFARISRGQYRFTNYVPVKKPVENKLVRDGKGKNEPSGVRQAVRTLKEKNPQMTAKEVLNHLVASGFDFKGRKPTSAVNLTWGYLGYTKEGKQQSLPGVR